MNDFSKFYTLEPMRYFDCKGNYSSPKAQAMINNSDSKYIATHKSDGEWGRLIVGEDGLVTIQSRSISKVTGEYGDKTGQLPQIVAEAKTLFAPQTVLLGEICFDDITTTSRDVGSILRCLPAKAVLRQEKGQWLYFKVFDCLAMAGVDCMDVPYARRLQMIDGYLKILKHKTHYIKICDYTTCNFTDFLADILRLGGEGIVIHSKDYLYAPGKRTAWMTLKVKKSTGEIEVPVIDTLAPTKVYTGIDRNHWEFWEGDTPVTKPYYYGWRSGIMVNHNGNLVRVASGLTDEDRAWLATDEAAQAIAEGRLVAVISGMEITEDSIRHPRLIRLRTDA